MKTKGLIIILLMVINIMFFNINIVQAEDVSDVFEGGDKFLETGKGSTSMKINETNLQNTSKMIYNILLILGICVAVVIAAILGIKFMIGSVEEKAQVKDALVPFVIGCVVVFGAFGFWKIFVTIGNNFSDESVEVSGNVYEKGKLYCSSCNAKLNLSDVQYRSKEAYITCSSCNKSYKIVCDICYKNLAYDDIVKGICTGQNGIGTHNISDSIMKKFIIYKKSFSY